MRHLLEGLKWLAISLTTIIVSFLLINTFDEELKPGAAAFAEFSNDTMPMEQNA